MNRREFMQCAALLVSGMAAGRAGLVLSEEQRHFIAAANYNASAVNYFSVAQRAVVAAIAEIIMPATDTPGANDAGVPQFIELMVTDWLNKEEQRLFNEGLKELMGRALSQHGKDFHSLSPSEQLKMLEKLESEASDSSWYEFGNTQREYLSDAPFICQIKELTIWGFFTSEVGATQVLRYEAMPMKFDGHRELGPNDSSWATGQI